MNALDSLTVCFAVVAGCVLQSQSNIFEEKDVWNSVATKVWDQLASALEIICAFLTGFIDTLFGKVLEREDRPFTILKSEIMWYKTMVSWVINTMDDCSYKKYVDLLTLIFNFFENRDKVFHTLFFEKNRFFGIKNHYENLMVEIKKNPLYSSLNIVIN